MRSWKVLTAVVLAGVLGALAPAPSAFAGEPAKGAVSEADRREFREAFAEEGGVLIREIITQYPEEYRAFETMIVEGIAAGALTDEEAAERGFEFTRGLAGKLYEGWRMAPDADIVASSQLSLTLATRLSALDQRACAEMLEGGLSVSSALALADSSDDIFEQNNASMLRLAKAGRQAQVKRAPVSDVEIASLVDAYTAAGGDLRWLTGQSSGDFAGLSPAGRCASGMTFLKTILRLPPALAARILTTE